MDIEPISSLNLLNNALYMSSVSDPHTLNADPDLDPGLWLNTDPGSGSRIPDPGYRIRISDPST